MIIQPAVTPDLISFNAGSLMFCGNNTVHLFNNDLPSMSGMVFSGLNLSANVSLNADTCPIAHGNILTFTGTGLTQLMMGYDSEATGNQESDYAGLYIRNKGPNAHSYWSKWYEILDTHNFAAYITGGQIMNNVATGRWAISIDGCAEVAKYLKPTHVVIQSPI